jgi:hypothetical protein
MGGREVILRSSSTSRDFQRILEIDDYELVFPRFSGHTEELEV